MNIIWVTEMKKLLQLSCLVLTTAFLGLSTSSADIFVNEDFSHTDGALVGNIPTPGPGNAWAAHSGAGNKAVQVTSGAILLTQSGGSGEDVNSSFTAIGATDTIYSRFDVSLASGQTVDPDGNGMYFAHFG